MFRFKDLLVPPEGTHLTTSQLSMAGYQELVDQAQAHRVSVSRMGRYLIETGLDRMRGPLVRDAVKGPAREHRKTKSRLKPRPTRKVTR